MKKRSKTWCTEVMKFVNVKSIIQLGEYPKYLVSSLLLHHTVENDVR